MRQFLKQALASTVGSLFGLTLFSGISLTLFTAIIGAVIQSVSTTDEAVKVPEKSILTIDLSQSIVDLDPGKTLQQVFAGESTHVIELKSVLNAIDAAAKDRRILAIYLDGSGGKQANTAGFATLKEVRTALERFRASGKQIIAYNIDMDKRDYYLSSVANQSLSIRWVRSILMAFGLKQCFSKMLLINMGLG